MRIKKLVVGLLLSATLVFAGFTPASKTAEAYAEDSLTYVDGDVTYKYTVNSDNKTCTITGCSCENEKSIIIPNNIDDCKVTSIGEEAFSCCTNLISIKIPNSVTTIGKFAFYYCTSLTHINIPNGVAIIKNDTFNECTSLTSIKIPNSVTTIEEGAFNNCTSLTSIKIPNSVTTIENLAFGIDNHHNNENILLYVVKDSYGEQYAKDNEIPYEYFTGTNSWTTDDEGNITSIEEGESLVLFIGNMSASPWNLAAENNIMTTVEGCDGVVSYTATFPAYDESNKWKSRFTLIGNYNDGENEVLGGWTRLLLGEPQYLPNFDHIPLTNISIRPTKNTEVTIYFDTNTSTIYCEDSKGNEIDYYISWVGNDDDEAYMTPAEYAAMTYEDYYASLTIDDGRADLDAIETEKTLFSATYQENKTSLMNSIKSSDSYNTYLNGWQTRYGQTYYYIEGEKAEGWQPIDDDWYYFSEGVFYTGLSEINDSYFYFNQEGVMQTGWQKIDNKWYYFNSIGIMQTGWVIINNKWYYFNLSGNMLTGWQPIGNNWYYLNKSGILQTGWFKSNGKWFYFNNSGVMVTGWNKLSGSYYYFNNSGSMATGWKKLSGKWYYFGTNGKMVSDTTMTIDGKSYTFNASGAMV